MENLKDAASIADFLFCPEKNTILWLFDQSSCHRAFAEDALNVRRMNVRPGGAQPRLRNTSWGRKTQTLVDDNGVPKGMRKVLEERGINTERMNAQDMRIVLSHHDDFKRERTVVEKYLSDRGHMVLFNPQIPL